MESFERLKFKWNPFFFGDYSSSTVRRNSNSTRSNSVNSPARRAPTPRSARKSRASFNSHSVSMDQSAMIDQEDEVYSTPCKEIRLIDSTNTIEDSVCHIVESIKLSGTKFEKVADKENSSPSTPVATKAKVKSATDEKARNEDDFSWEFECPKYVDFTNFTQQPIRQWKHSERIPKESKKPTPLVQPAAALEKITFEVEKPITDVEKQIVNNEKTVNEEEQIVPEKETDIDETLKVEEEKTIPDEDKVKVNDEKEKVNEDEKLSVKVEKHEVKVIHESMEVNVEKEEPGQEEEAKVAEEKVKQVTGEEEMEKKCDLVSTATPDNVRKPLRRESFVKPCATLPVTTTVKKDDPQKKLYRLLSFTAPQRSKFRSLAEISRDFEQKIRVYTPPTRKQNKTHWMPTKPVSPNLISSKRKRALTCVSHKQQEENMVQSCKKNTFKATPFNKNKYLSLVNVGVRRVDPKPTTKPIPFSFASEKRIQARRSRITVDLFNRHTSESSAS